jgi:hypothetical protein
MITEEALGINVPGKMKSMHLVRPVTSVVFATAGVQWIDSAAIAC